MRSQSSSLIWSMGAGGVGAGVVDENIDAAHLREGGFGEAFHIVAVVHVGDDVDAFAAGAGEDFGEGRPEFAFVAAGDDDVRARLGEGAGHRFAEALAAAGDQSDAAGEIETLVDHFNSSIMIASAALASAGSPAQPTDHSS